ncbi:hypothetical protein EDD22DRAFT_956344 [Suillus occidentalis]|nr:hypothetical protein EDD22DRAFT_956344 [Suillus occidentalis]
METARGPAENQNKVQRAQYHDALTRWEEEKAMAKAKGHRFTEKKPALDEDGQSASGEEFDLNDMSDDSGEEE